MELEVGDIVWLLQAEGMEDLEEGFQAGDQATIRGFYPEGLPPIRLDCYEVEVQGKGKCYIAYNKVTTIPPKEME
jgi:hypothetical protein